MGKILPNNSVDRFANNTRAFKVDITQEVEASWNRTLRVQMLPRHYKPIYSWVELLQGNSCKFWLLF